MSADWGGVTRLFLFVTGHTEAECLESLLGKIAAGLNKVLIPQIKLRFDQRPRKRIHQIGRAAPALSNHENAASQVGGLVSRSGNFFMWIDDLENDARGRAADHFAYYAYLLDRYVTVSEVRSRCSAHFLVNMLEAYFLADPAAVNAVLQTNLGELTQNCENIRSPAGKLDEAVKAVNPSRKYDKTDHGVRIARSLNLEQVLSDKTRCRALRTLIAWCWEAIGEPRSERFCLTDGVYWDVTAGQLQNPPSDQQRGPLDVEEPYRPVA